MKTLLLPLLVSVTPFGSAAPLVFEGMHGPGVGRHIVFLAGDHEYRSEEILPALARILAQHHGFKCTGEPIQRGQEPIQRGQVATFDRSPRSRPTAALGCAKRPS